MNTYLYHLFISFKSCNQMPCVSSKTKANLIWYSSCLSMIFVYNFSRSLSLFIQASVHERKKKEEKRQNGACLYMSTRMHIFFSKVISFVIYDRRKLLFGFLQFFFRSLNIFCRLSTGERSRWNLSFEWEYEKSLSINIERGIELDRHTCHELYCHIGIHTWIEKVINTVLWKKSMWWLSDRKYRSI